MFLGVAGVRFTPKRDHTVQLALEGDKFSLHRMRSGEIDPGNAVYRIKNDIENYPVIGYQDLYPKTKNEDEAIAAFKQDVALAYKNWAAKHLDKMRYAEITPDEAKPVIESSLAKAGLDMRALYPEKENVQDAMAAFGKEASLAYKNFAIKSLDRMNQLELDPKIADTRIKDSLAMAGLDARTLYPAADNLDAANAKYKEELNQSTQAYTTKTLLEEQTKLTKEQSDLMRMNSYPTHNYPPPFPNSYPPNYNGNGGHHR